MPNLVMIITGFLLHFILISDGKWQICQNFIPS